MIPSPSDAYKYALSMELRSDCFKFAIIHSENGQVAFFKEVEFDFYDESSLKDLLNEEYFNLEYKTISISVSTQRTTLVPVSIFNSSNPKAIFKLNHSEPIDNIDYSRLPELGLVSIYEIPLWIKSVMIKKFLKIKIVHHSTVLLKGIFNQSNYRPKAHILIENDLFYISITDKNKLSYFNLFNSTEITDLVYYYLFILDQKEIDVDTIPIHFYGRNSNHKSVRSLEELLSKKLIIKDSSKQNSDFIITNQLLCV